MLSSKIQKLKVSLFVLLICEGKKFQTSFGRLWGASSSVLRSLLSNFASKKRTLSAQEKIQKVAVFLLWWVKNRCSPPTLFKKEIIQQCCWYWKFEVPRARNLLDFCRHVQLHAFCSLGRKLFFFRLRISKWSESRIYVSNNFVLLRVCSFPFPNREHPWALKRF